MRVRRSTTTQVVWHCSATKSDWQGHVGDIAHMHKARGWQDIGYHIVISREGLIAFGEDPRLSGAHAKGVNRTSIAVCMVGGVDSDDATTNNFTPEQWESAAATYKFLKQMYPEAEHLGHRDLSPDLDGDGAISEWEWMKLCPCFNVSGWIMGGLVALPSVGRGHLRPEIIVPDIPQPPPTPANEPEEDDDVSPVEDSRDIGRRRRHEKREARRLARQQSKDSQDDNDDDG